MTHGSPHALDYQREDSDKGAPRFLRAHAGNFIAGTFLGFSIGISMSALYWLLGRPMRHRFEHFAMHHQSFDITVAGFGLMMALVAFISVARLRSGRGSLLAAVGHGVLAGIGFAIAAIGLYHFAVMSFVVP